MYNFLIKRFFLLSVVLSSSVGYAANVKWTDPTLGLEWVLLDGDFNYDEAKAACTSLGDGYRIPAITNFYVAEDTVAQMHNDVRQQSLERAIKTPEINSVLPVTVTQDGSGFKAVWTLRNGPIGCNKFLEKIDTLFALSKLRFMLVCSSDTTSSNLCDSVLAMCSKALSGEEGYPQDCWRRFDELGLRADFMRAADVSKSLRKRYNECQQNSSEGSFWEFLYGEDLTSSKFEFLSVMKAMDVHPTLCLNESPKGLRVYNACSACNNGRKACGVYLENTARWVDYKYQTCQ